MGRSGQGLFVVRATWDRKTRFAAALAAHCGLHLEATSIPKWQSYKDGDLGDMLKAMYQTFASAKENSPCLLFLDEFDAIGDRAKFLVGTRPIRPPS